MCNCLATSSTWKLSHPSKHCWIWNTKVILYDKSKLELRKCELNTINGLKDTLPNVFSWFFAQKPALLMVVCYLEALKNKRSSETWLVHPSFPHLWSRRKFLEKIGNIFLYHLVGLSSCNTRFEGEKWESSQLEYSGGMQLFQKDFDMKKTYVDAPLARKTYTEYRKTCQSLILIQNIHSSGAIGLCASTQGFLVI